MWSTTLRQNMHGSLEKARVSYKLSERLLFYSRFVPRTGARNSRIIAGSRKPTFLEAWHGEAHRRGNQRSRRRPSLNGRAVRSDTRALDKYERSAHTRW